MAKNKSKLEEVLEGYKPIPMKRMFYPRGMKLSEDFINAFHREYDRLVDEGVNPKTLVERVSKAMKFHVNDPRTYHQLDEEEKKKSGDDKCKVCGRPRDNHTGVRHPFHEKPAPRAGEYIGDKEKIKESSHDCEKDHPGKSHKEWEKKGKKSKKYIPSEAEAAAMTAPHGQDQSYS